MRRGDTPIGQRWRSRVTTWRTSRSSRRRGTLAVGASVVLLLISFLVTSSIWPTMHQLLPLRQAFHLTTTHPQPTQTRTGLSQWVGDKRTTAPRQSTVATAATTGNIIVDPLFQSYYNRHGGAAQLGQPLTPAFPTTDGWLQVFTATALMLPSAAAVKAVASAASSGSTSGDPLIPLLRDGVHDPQSEVVELSLLHRLLTEGSENKIGGAGSPLTYVSIRSATDPAKRLTENPIKDQADSVFVPEQTDQNKYAGHRVPIALWNFMNQPAIAPEGWQQDFGQPLTEALPVTITDADGTTHHELVQAFWQTILIVDMDTLNAPNGPTIRRAPIGQDYLTTFTLPAAQVTPDASAWVSADTTVRGTPTTTGSALAHLGASWPLTLKGASTWTDGALWYQVSWHAGNRTSEGWIPAVATTSAKPDKSSVPSAGVDVLSPTLNSYLAGLNGAAGVAIYDVTRNQWYSYDGDNAYIMGSSAKIPIMLAYLTSVEQQGRGLTDEESWLLTTMIENSNNDSAQVLFDTLGGDPAIINYLQSVGLSTSIYHPNPEGWGWATLSPNTMVHLLTMLYQNTILTSGDRATALRLMNHIESDQRFGVGDTAPSGATVYMKDGWVIGPEGSWDANSSGIVTIGHETYIISVYTTGQSNLDVSYGILRHVCSAVVPLLS